MSIQQYPLSVSKVLTGTVYLTGHGYFKTAFSCSKLIAPPLLSIEFATCANLQWCLSND